MSCQKLSRHAVHMVLSGGRGMYSLSRMDVLGLFYPSVAEAEAAQVKAKKMKNGINKLGVVGSIRHLPAPCIHYEPFRPAMSEPYNWIDVFALFGKSKDKILCSDAAGHSTIYHTELHSFLGMPMLNSPKGPNYMAVSIPRTAVHARFDFEIHPEVDSHVFTNQPPGDHNDSLYILDMSPTTPCAFEVLAYYPMGNWCWRPLPPPPFFHDPEYEAPQDIRFTMIGDTICLSTTTATYFFDTVTLKWRKAGDWVLPFKAEYVPELGLWLGLSDDSPYCLYTMDLSAVVDSSSSMPPIVQHVGQDLEPPENWRLLHHALVNLGSGRLCIAKIFDIINDQDEYDFIPVAIFTGVEVLPCDVGGLRMIKHKSKCIVTDSIHHVL